jgi:hypothetical protein
MGFGYLWVDKKSMYHMLLGRQADGSENVKYIPDPDFVPRSTMDWTKNPLTEDIIIDWEEEIQSSIPPLLAIPQPPVIFIRPDISVVQAVVYKEDRSSYLVSKHLPKEITESIILGITSPFSHHKNYPKIEIRKHEVRVHFQPDSYDANFAAFLLLKKPVSINKQTHMVSFRIPSNKIF